MSDRSSWVYFTLLADGTQVRTERPADHRLASELVRVI